MSKKRKVALDLDDVIFKFYPGMCKRYGMPEIACNIWDGSVGGDCEWIADAMEDVNKDMAFYLSLDFLSEPSSINFEVSAYITSSPEEFTEARSALLNAFGFPKAPIYFSKNKLQLMKELDLDVMVDDSPRTCGKINSDPGKQIGIQFIPPYMTDIGDENLSIRHLSQLNKFL
tara:strand:+ start:94 stop:612 length:519 start_codon:yes stop_codon:yes gene_type:complete